MIFRWPFRKSKPSLVVNSAVDREVFRNPLNRLAQLIDGESCRRMGRDLRAYHGQPPGSFLEPSLHPNGRVYAYGTVVMRYTIRNSRIRKWLVFYRDEETIEIIDLIALPFVAGR